MSANTSYKALFSTLTVWLVKSKVRTQYRYSRFSDKEISKLHTEVHFKQKSIVKKGHKKSSDPKNITGTPKSKAKKAGAFFAI